MRPWAFVLVIACCQDSVALPDAGAVPGVDAAGPLDAHVPADAAADAATAGDPLPPGAWSLVWWDDFDGTVLDGGKWRTASDSYSDGCRGNHPDHKLEYNLPDNLSLGGGVLTITARAQDYRSPSGIQYTWTSGLITTGHNCGPPPYVGVTVRPGDFVSMRAKLPGVLGMWPALWTWNDEVDVFEYHWDNPRLLELTNHTAGGGADYYQAASDLSQGWHWFGALLGADHVVWYLDGAAIYTGGGFASSGASIIIDLAVSDGTYHPAPTVTSAQMQVDSIRVFRMQ